MEEAREIDKQFEVIRRKQRGLYGTSWFSMILGALVFAVSLLLTNQEQGAEWLALVGRLSLGGGLLFVLGFLMYYLSTVFRALLVVLDELKRTI